MKKFAFLFAIIVISCSAGKAQFADIPDSNFRHFLQYTYPSCFNASGQLDTTCSEIVNEDTLFAGVYTAVNFEGLRYFKRLKYLDCGSSGYGNSIPALPDSLLYFSCMGSSGLIALPPLPSTLQYLNCSYLYRITTLPTLPPGLKRLECSDCWGLISLPTLPATLQYLNIDRCRTASVTPGPIISALPPALDTLSCTECLLTTLPALPEGIKYVNCSRNPITSLPAFPNSISYLDCSYFKWPYYYFDDTTLVDLPALPANLQTFYCQSSGIRAMQPLPNHLITLKCDGTPIGNSITFPSTLKTLQCPSCNIHSFPALPNSLIYLDIRGNPIYSIPNIPDSLTFLSCAYDSLSTLPALPTGLNMFFCYNNQLTNLPSLPNNIENIDCQGNRLSSLPPLPARLKTLACQYNQLVSLPAFPDSLSDINCQSNQLISLPALPSLLNHLFCDYNQLTYLPAIPNNTNEITCMGNNIYCLPKLPQSEWGYFSLNIDSKIKCLPNNPPRLILTIADSSFWPGLIRTLPLCNPTNNIAQCQSFPVMQGSVFFDNNNNGLKDTNEPIKNYARISLSNSNYTFSNNDGQYEIAADSIGNYHLTSLARRYYRYVPAAYNYNFINYDTLITGADFALQIDSVVDELTVRVSPISWAARPGFSFPYMISYENTGTTTLSPNIIFDYDQSGLTYSTSSVTGVVDNTDNLTYNAGALQPGESGSFIGYFNVKATVPLGDTLNAKATITANSFAAYDSIQTIVRGAFDPNDKEATPQLSPSQVAAGKYIDYTIHFQNTGNDTAFNIVISDTLSSDLQAGSLEMIASSHSCKTTVKDGIVFFEFLNIWLPDKNINEPMSHGFVSFRIKPVSTVAVNTIIPNKAAIYFDYNVPVITNTAGTLIKDFTVVPLHLVSFTAVPQFNNTTALSWITSNEINTKHFVIEQSNDAYHFTTVATVLAKGRANNYYNSSVKDLNNSLVYYRLKMVDIDGSYTYSPVIKIDRRKNTAGFAVLSNPVKDAIIINTNDDKLNGSDCKIINMQGTVVKHFMLQQGSQRIDVSGLPTGIYYIRNTNGSEKILIQR